MNTPTRISAPKGARMKIKKKPKKDKNKCPKCNGSKSNFADDYFIRKCWCNESASEDLDYKEYE